MSSTAVPSISAFRSCCRRYRMTFACTRCCRASLVNVPRELYVVSRKHRHCFATNLGNFHTLTVYCKDYLISRVRIMVNQSMVNNVVNLLGTFWKRCRENCSLGAFAGRSATSARAAPDSPAPQERGELTQRICLPPVFA